MWKKIRAEKRLQLFSEGLHFRLKMLYSSVLCKESNWNSIVFKENSRFSLERYSIYFNLGVKLKESFFRGIFFFFLYKKKERKPCRLPPVNTLFFLVDLIQ